MGKKILLVEDEAIIAMSQAAVLKKHGFEVLNAYSGEKAVETVLRDEDLSIILMDIDLGKGIDGTQAARKILEERDLPIIFLTSHAEKEYVDRVKEISGYGYVLKNSGEFVLIESINMAFSLFESQSETRRHMTVLESREHILRHVNRVLQSLRELNHSIIHDSDLDSLITSVCRTLVETSGYTRVWIIITRGGRPVPSFYYYGVIEGAGSFGDYLLKGNIPHCARQALLSRSVIITENSENQCADCPFGKADGAGCVRGKSDVSFTTSLYHEDTEFGWITAVLPYEYSDNQEDTQLFAEIAEDISYAMENLAREEGLRDSNHRLKEQEERYETLYTHATLPYQSLDMNGCFLDINPAWLRTLGYSREMVIGAYFEDFLHPEDLEKFRAYFPKLMGRGTMHELQVRLRHNKGHYLDVSFEGCVGHYPDGRIRQTYCVFKDISQVKKLEAMKELEQRRFRALFNNIVEGVCFHELIYNDEGKPADYRILNVNRSYESILGLSLSSVAGRPASEVYGTDPAPYLDLYTAVVETGNADSFETYYTPMDKYFIISVFATGKKGFATIFFEMTDHVRTREYLNQERMFLKQIAEASPVGIIKIDGQGRIVFANKQAGEILGEKTEVITSRQFDDPSWRAESLEGITMTEDELPFALVQDTGRPVYGMQHVYFDSQDRRKVLSVNAVPVFSESSEFDGAVMALEDITMRVEAEGKLQSALDEKDFLMKEINHRVKNNLMLISSLINLKNDSLGNSVDLSDISHQIDTIRILHERLYSSDDIRRVDMAEYFRSILDSIFSTFSASRIKVLLNAENISLPAREAIPFGLILNELAINAIKYAFPNIAEPVFSVKLFRDADNVLICEMGNNGPPIPEDISLDNPSTLGLRLVSALVAQLRGRIEVEKRASPLFRITIVRKFE